MPIDIVLPALAPSMEQGTLTRWLKKEGDAIQHGDVLAEIETDKTVLEIEATDVGILSKILIPEGTANVAVNTVLAIVSSAEEWTAAKGPPKAVPVTESPTVAAPPNGNRIMASPLARRLASESGIDLSTLKGSGPSGRIIERDVGAATRLPPVAPLAVTPKPVAVQGSVPHTLMRRTIAQRLSESKRTVPHFYLEIDCELDALVTLKDEYNREAPKDSIGTPLYKLSLNDCLIKAWALSLARTPDSNVSWTEEAMLQHADVGIAVAIAVPGGLVTPVIRQAERKGLADISREVKALAARAKERRLKPQDYEGGSSSMSNLGMYGIKRFAAILNPPQATLLAIGAGFKRVIVKDDEPAIATLMTCTLSVDHRAIDGALGAELLAAFKTSVESPLRLFVP